MFGHAVRGYSPRKKTLKQVSAIVRSKIWGWLLSAPVVVIISRPRSRAYRFPLRLRAAAAVVVRQYD